VHGASIGAPSSPVMRFFAPPPGGDEEDRCSLGGDGACPPPSPCARQYWVAVPRGLHPPRPNMAAHRSDGHSGRGVELRRSEWRPTSAVESWRVAQLRRAELFWRGPL
jgi:hypothetical protein